MEASRKKNEVIRDETHYAAIAPLTSTSIPQIGINACKAGYKVLFINAKDLIDRL